MSARTFKYGQSGSSCQGNCSCYAGIMDLYCTSFEPGAESSLKAFTKTSSTGPASYPDNGAVIESQWQVPWTGVTPIRAVARSKAAWQNDIVVQIEDGIHSFSFGNDNAYHNPYTPGIRAGREHPDVPIGLQVTSRDINAFGRWLVHSGDFEARAASRENGVYPAVYPLHGLAATDSENLMSIDANLSGMPDFSLETGFRNTADFTSCAILFRFQDPQNHMRLLIQKSPAIFAIQEVVAGVATTIASDSITYDDEFFRSGNYNDKLNEERDISYDFGKVEADKLIKLTVEGNVIKANLNLIIYRREVNTENIVETNVTLSATSSYLSDATRVGFYSPDAEVAFDGMFAIGPVNPTTFPDNDPGYGEKIYLSIYNDSTPEQLAEFDVTDVVQFWVINHFDHFYDARSVQQVCGTLVAGGEKSLWIRPADQFNEDETDRTLKVTDELPPQNESLYLLYYNRDEDDLDQYWVGHPVREYYQSLGSWTFTEYFPYQQIESFDADEDAASQFLEFPYKLGYQAHPAFAQHSYPLACGYRLTNVSWNRTDDGSGGGRVYDLTGTHEIIGGNVIWSGRDLPYIDDTDPAILFSIDETITDIVTTNHEPTEDFMRNQMALDLPVKYFEADPDLSAYVVGLDQLDALGGIMGLARINTGTPIDFEYNFSVAGNAAAAPGGRLAISDIAWDGPPDNPASPPTYTRFRILSDAGVLYQSLRDVTPVSPPARPALTQTSFENAFLVHAASDEYVYVRSAVMNQQEISEFAEHSVPLIQRNTNFNHTQLPGLNWLISWDSTVRVPCISKHPYDPVYREKRLFVDFFFADDRSEQAFDCIKDSSLPYAPNFSLSAEGTVPFVCDYDDFYMYLNFDVFPAVRVIDPEVFTVPADCTSIVVECWGAGGGGAAGYRPEPVTGNPDYDGITNPVLHDLYEGPGTYTWTCPADVYGVIVEIAGPGGDGTSDWGGGGSAVARSWFDTTPGTDYEVFVVDKTGSPSYSYFIDADHLQAARGVAATISAAGAGGTWVDTLGTIMRDGVDGDSENGGNAGLSFYTNTFTGPQGLGGTTGSINGEAHGGGGAETNGLGGDGAAQLSYRTGYPGHGGGGAGGYARSEISVTPDDDYNLQVGLGGTGQLGITTTEAIFMTYVALVHGESSTFGDDPLVQGAGADSAGSDAGDDYEALRVGALGGGQFGAHESNIGDVTFPGGNGGDGGGIRRRFGMIGGGGGGAAGEIGAGENGQDGNDGGTGGRSSNDFNSDGFYESPRVGAGGRGQLDSTTRFLQRRYRLRRRWRRQCAFLR
jgi:hypothetical protein